MQTAEITRAYIKALRADYVKGVTTLTFEIRDGSITKEALRQLAEWGEGEHSVVFGVRRYLDQLSFEEVSPVEKVVEMFAVDSPGRQGLDEHGRPRTDTDGAAEREA